MTDTVSTEELLQEFQRNLEQAYGRIRDAENSLKWARTHVSESNKAAAKILLRRSVEMGESNAGSV